MIIRKTTHANNRNGQKYDTDKLVESVRTQRAPPAMHRFESVNVFTHSEQTGHAGESFADPEKLAIIVWNPRPKCGGGGKPDT